MGSPGLKEAHELEVAVGGNNYLAVRSHNTDVLVGARIPRSAKLEAIREQQFAKYAVPTG